MVDAQGADVLLAVDGAFYAGRKAIATRCLSLLFHAGRHEKTPADGAEASFAGEYYQEDLIPG